MKQETLLNIAGIAVLVVAWGMFIGPGHVAIPPLSRVVKDIVSLAESGEIFVDGIASLERVTLGVFVAAALALSLAVLAAFWPTFGHLLGGIVELMRPIPPLAWVPIAILAFGIGDKPAIAIVALGAFFPIWLGLSQGFTEVRSQHLLVAQSFGASAYIRLFDVIVPSVMPYAFHGLRLGIGLGWFCVVAAELMGANSGLGYGVQLNSINLSLGKTYSYVLAIAVLGAAMNVGMQLIEWRLFRWHRLAVGGNE
jgi:ABC-type nitrate/sulfonate/bicarbonate transport system permease component